MEEQRQRQDTGGKSEGTATTTDTPSVATPTATTGATTGGEDSLLMNAMYPSAGGSVDYNAMSEEEQIALAIQMSMSDANPTESTESKDKNTPAPVAMETESEAASSEPMEEDYSEVMNDPAFLQHLVGSLPGVDPNSAAIQNALQALTGNQEDEPKQDDKDKKKEDKS